MKNTRAGAATALAAVLGKGSTLDEALIHAERGITGRDRALLRELGYGCCRRFGELDGLLAQLLDKPLKSRDLDLRALMLVGLYQLRHLRVPDHAAVAETVSGCAALGKPWARGLVNAVLRRYQAHANELAGRLDRAQALSHPAWLLDALERAWPEQFAAIIAANNSPGPLTVRVNRQRLARKAWIELAQAAGLEPRAGTLAPDAVVLGRAVDVAELPGFAEGAVSVQDEAAQLAATLLPCTAGQRVLDACAAPGGKSCHLLETAPDVLLLALDVSAPRLARIEENLARTGMRASVCEGDATRPGAWWDGVAFDQILVDAPCSGTGVIRRHPDIKLLRTPPQVHEAATLQRAILAALWPCLAPGGTLLYSTCSVLPEENEAVVRAFLTTTDDAYELPIDSSWGVQREHGRQLLPEAGGWDGFYYARLRKSA